MSEEQLERVVEHLTDRLDSRFLRGELTQAEYDAEYRQLDRRAAGLARRVEG